MQPRLTMLERNHLLGRIRTVEAHKLEGIKKRKVKAARSLSPAKRYSLIKAGKVKLKKDIREISEYSDVVKVFDFSAYEWDDIFDEVGYFNARSKVVSAANKIRDEVVLGQPKKALKLLAKFEKLNIKT